MVKTFEEPMNGGDFGTRPSKLGVFSEGGDGGEIIW
jgi:hypothetical protein